MYGDLGKDWRDRSVVIGPIAFVGLPGAATAPRRDFVPNRDGFKSWKALAVVDVGTVVTISISPQDQGRVSLLYDTATFNSRQMTDGETAVTFRACAEGESPFERFGVADGPIQFNGAFIVDGPQCAALEVRGGTGPAKRVDVAFGRGTCA